MLCVLYFYNVCIVCIRNGKSFDIHWYGGGPSMAMVFHLIRVSDLFYDLRKLTTMSFEVVVWHCSIFFECNKMVRVQVRKRGGGTNLSFVHMASLWWYLLIGTWITFCLSQHLKKLGSVGSSTSHVGPVRQAAEPPPLMGERGWFVMFFKAPTISLILGVKSKFWYV